MHKIALLFASLVVALSLMAKVAAQPIDIEFDDSNYAGTPPALNYVEGGAPVYYADEPTVAYYPILLDYPGSCDCIMPVRFYYGTWYAHGGIPLYHGYFTLHHPKQKHRDTWASGIQNYNISPAGTRQPNIKREE